MTPENYDFSLLPSMIHQIMCTAGIDLTLNPSCSIFITMNTTSLYENRQVGDRRLKSYINSFKIVYLFFLFAYL